MVIIISSDSNDSIKLIRLKSTGYTVWYLTMNDKQLAFFSHRSYIALTKLASIVYHFAYILIFEINADFLTD